MMFSSAFEISFFTLLENRAERRDVQGKLQLAITLLL